MRKNKRVLRGIGQGAKFIAGILTPYYGGSIKCIT